MIFLANGGTLSEFELRVLYVYPGCSHFDIVVTSKIDDVLFELGRLL